VRRNGPRFPVAATTPQFNSLLGVAGSVLGNGAREALLATRTLYTAPAEGAILAGLPTMVLTMSPVAPSPLDTACLPAGLPDVCEPVLYLGLGLRRAGTERWDLIDDQLTPIRGFGFHRRPMTGIAERLQPGDELGLLIYAFHAQYPISGSRGLAVPAVNLGGQLVLPLVPASDVVQPAL
jgi:ABC-2 type transport system ATP-binding protein